MEKKLLSIQVSLFFKKSLEEGFENIGINLKKYIVDAKSEFIPVPSDVPRVFPRLILRRQNFIANFYPHRADLIFEGDYNQVNDLVKQVLIVLFENNATEIGRVGYVENSFAEEKSDYLRVSLREDIVNNTDLVKEVNLRINIGTKIGEFKCNNIESFNPGFATIDSEKKQGLIITRDINTLSEDVGNNNFSQNNIFEFLDEARRIAGQTLLKSF